MGRGPQRSSWVRDRAAADEGARPRCRRPREPSPSCPTTITGTRGNDATCRGWIATDRPGRNSDYDGSHRCAVRAGRAERYARVPAELKEAADAYASQRGKTLTGAVVELLDRGLNAETEERSVAEPEANLATVTAQKAQAEAELQTAKARLAAVDAFAKRARRDLGTCPKCKGKISGADLLASGQCPSCSYALASLIAPESATPTLDQRELLILVGALGAVLGIAYLASK